jgi:hypothetical protein
MSKIKISDYKTIKEAWNSFETHIIPKNAPALQKIEMKKAFYAGAWGMVNILINLEDKEGDNMTDEKMEEYIDKLFKECLEIAGEPPEKKGFH